jgi:hypothetical protein
MAFKEDMQASVAELVYGKPLRIPGELLTPNAKPVDPAHFITKLCQHMTHLRPSFTPTENHRQIIVLYILIFMFLDSRLEDKRFWTQW